MDKNKYFTTFYLDKERDIIVNLYMSGENELEFVLETPYHNTGNLISNLARICKLETVKNENDIKIIKGKIPASINAQNEEVYIFKIGGYGVANIFKDGGIQLNGQIPAIAKTLMSQTKEYNFPIEKTIVKSYILKKLKFRTDLHTHMNANLSPDCLIALGIKHQIKYPLYYIKKLNLKMTEQQSKFIFAQREKVTESFKNSNLQGKYLDRKIDDNTFINFADFILNNLENSKENIEKIRRSLAILKDGQAVFTNLEKLYLYRYVFTKGIPSEKGLNLEEEIDKVEKIPVKEVKDIVKTMLADLNEKSEFKENNLIEDKLLWIGREYKKQGIEYVEIADTTLTKKGMPAIEFLEEIHKMMPKIEKETGVKIRFLVAIRRIPLNILQDSNGYYLRENLNVLKAVSKSPYVVGSDFIGEEINDISELKPVVKEIVEYVEKEDKGYTIRIHAGENDSLKDNVANSIKCVKDALSKGQEMPKLRIGHGLYTANLESEEGKKLIKEIKNDGAVMEFQITSNVRLNNLSKLSSHPLKKYLQNGIKCVQGTDGCGLYGIDTIDEQLALQNFLELSEEDFSKMRETENEFTKDRQEYFALKNKKFEEWLAGKEFKDAFLEEEKKYFEENKNNKIELCITDKVLAKDYFKYMTVKSLPLDKIPIVIAGGSFNTRGIHTNVEDKGRKVLENLVESENPREAYFVIGHKIRGYEKELIDICKEKKKNFEIYAIIPNMISKKVKERLLKSGITGVCISIESEDSGIYKSFNYEIFERRSSIVYAFDGNSPVSNLVQEAKNGKGKAKIFVNGDNENLRQKAEDLVGYVTVF